MIKYLYMQLPIQIGISFFDIKLRSIKNFLLMPCVIDFFLWSPLCNRAEISWGKSRTIKTETKLAIWSLKVTRDISIVFEKILTSV